jgi:TonB-linked SusC/RagA family outer membrane protein
MEKNEKMVDSGGFHPQLTQLIRIMKLTSFLFFFAVAQVLAVSSYSQATKLSLNLKNTTVKDVLLEIEENSEFYFLYSNKLIDVERKVDVKINNKRVENILDEIFEGEPVVYSINDRQIILSPEGMVINNSSGFSQQSKKLTGTVKSGDGEPLPGVTVIVKGTTTGTVTNADGGFLLDVPGTAESLMFSFVGMAPQEVAIGEQTVFNIIMISETIGLDEIVAIGYGTVKKSDLTGAVGSIQGGAITERQTTMVSQALQGAMAGVTVTRGNNAPGSAATIRIRGITTIGDSNPLIIVDGVPMDNIDDINPNDIQDISVLKDAASASIYGARAAAGVILVTTKRAKTGEIGLQYNMEYGFEKATQLPEYVDVTRYLQMANELRWNDNNNNANEYPLYPKNDVDNYLSLNAENPNKYPNTDWVDLILNETAPRQSHVLTISAGSNAVRTNASLSYDKTDALYDGRSYERITARLNNDFTINKFLAASLDFNFKRSISNQPNIDPMYYMLISAPVYAAEWQDGRVAEGKTGANIDGSLKYGGFNDSWYNDVGGKVALDFTPLDGLKISAILSPTLGFDKGKNFRKKVEYYSADDPTVYGGTLQWNGTTMLSETRNDNYRVTTQFLANYMKSFGSHNLNALAGYENYYAFNENMGASRDKYELTSYPYLNIGPLEFRDNSGSAWENAYRSWFGRVMYNFKNRYYLQGNVRFDASSRFHPDYRWGSFPSFSAGWVISEESFMKEIDFISFLKLRASWGTLGNERIGNYPYQSTIAFSNALFFQGANVISAQTAAQTKYAIEDISWETTVSTDLGIDASFLDNRLRFTGDYFMKTTKDMLLALEIPDYIGFDNPDQNTGEMETKGWEAELGWNDKQGDFGYSFSFHISDFKSKMGDLGGTEFLGDQVKKEGSEFNEWYGYLSDGLFQTDADLAASPKLNTSMKVGDVKYKDISGPDGVPDGKVSPEYDKVLLGGSLPRYLYGGNIRLNYKNFDFSLVIQGVGKVNDRLEGLMVQPLMENWGHIPKILDGTSWSKYNTEEQNLNAKYPRLSQNNRGNNYTMSDYWLFDGGYLRFKNMTLGYNIPSSVTSKINLQGVRVYGSISDFLTINNYPKGWDPEVSASGYPITSSFMFGLSVKF